MYSSQARRLQLLQSKLMKTFVYLIAQQPDRERESVSVARGLGQARPSKDTRSAPPASPVFMAIMKSIGQDIDSGI